MLGKGHKMAKAKHCSRKEMRFHVISILEEKERATWQNLTETQREPHFTPQLKAGTGHSWRPLNAHRPVSSPLHSSSPSSAKPVCSRATFSVQTELASDASSSPSQRKTVVLSPAWYSLPMEMYWNSWINYSRAVVSVNSHLWTR